MSPDEVVGYIIICVHSCVAAGIGVIVGFALGVVCGFGEAVGVEVVATSGGPGEACTKGVARSSSIASISGTNTEPPLVHKLASPPKSRSSFRFR